MRILVAGRTGALGQVTVPRLRAAGHEVVATSKAELDLLDREAVARAVAGVDAVMHLATRIPPVERMGEPGAWTENDLVRTEGSRNLVDAALDARIEVYVVPTITFVYPPGQADESTPIGEVPPHLRSALGAEAEAARFATAGGRGVVLRLGLLYGPGSGHDAPNPALNATLHTEDAAEALVAALAIPSGVYNVADDGGPVSCERFKRATGWQPLHGAQAWDYRDA
jgi:nucleoside-diphosphate-sugar epimerase